MSVGEIEQPMAMTQAEADEILKQMAQEAEFRTLMVSVPNAIKNSVARLILNSTGSPAFTFISVLAMRLTVAIQKEKDGPIAQSATDGMTFVVNPWWFDGLSTAEQAGCIAQAAFHNAMYHSTRRGARDLETWNRAADLAINQMIRDCGIPMPKDWILAGQGDYKSFPLGMNAEDYYDLLEQGDPGAGKGDLPCGCLDAPQGKAGEVEQAWNEAVHLAQDAANKCPGSMGPAMQRFIRMASTPKVDWRSVLREFLTRTRNDDYTWSRVSRRHVHQGIYLPGMESDKLGEIVIAIDTSGSVDDKTLAIFGAEVNSVLSAFNVHVKIVYCDDAIRHVDEWDSTDGEIKLQFNGGGGTHHGPVFDWVQEHAEEAIAVICLTDLFTQFPQYTPEKPVLWCVYGNLKPETPPFGELIVLDLRGERE